MDAKRYLTIDDEYGTHIVVDSNYCIEEELRIAIGRQGFYLNRETARLLRNAMNEWLSEMGE